MLKRLLFRNMSGVELRIMLEPWTTTEDASPGNSITLEAKFVEDELVIDIYEGNFLSVWSPPESDLKIS